MTIEMRKGDTWPPLRATLIEADGNPIDLTGATVTFQMEDDNNNEVINSSAIIESSSEGKVRYDWSPNDTDEVGTFEGDFVIEFPSGQIATVPNREYIPIYITDH